MYYQNQFIDGQDNNYPTRELADKSEKVLRNGQWLNRIGCVEKKGTLLYDVEIDDERFEVDAHTWIDAYYWAWDKLLERRENSHDVKFIEKVLDDDTQEECDIKSYYEEIEYDGYDAEKEYKLNVFGRAS